MKTYGVTVSGFPEAVYSALTPAKARVQAWYEYTSAFECTFKEFLKISTLRRCDVPEKDGYGYVRRSYGVDPKIGGRVRLINEGSSSGCEGEVAYPGSSTAHVRVLLDGRDSSVWVHPNNIRSI
ncbi:hypothetical protein [Pseudovibrio japonicus]|nr:hypothetical protein [Pseudovibrio japonicus]